MTHIAKMIQDKLNGVAHSKEDFDVMVKMLRDKTYDEAQLADFKKRKYQYMAKDREGRDVFLADSGYVLQMAQNDFDHIKFHFTSEF